ncbi:FMN-dependent NADH-azoreductase [Taibaiella koreensis]|uniref:FMN-dependent NADH-azoreductase n=1 Tax=Taibaiella koreensis TaxID=1268548 RepID=UPI000E59FDF7|nr:FMN-dependent NADH-azoreductase [Taibaiella koreensis]
MKKILHIISSPKQEGSMSRKLGNAIIEKLQAAYPGSTVTENNLVADYWPHIESAQANAFHTPAEQRTPEHLEALKHSDKAIQELMEADIIVIGAPVYNFSIHSSLKAWIDHIVRGGDTFKYSESGPEGMVKGKKVYLAISSGGVYSEGPMKPMDHGEPYLRFMLGFLGMTDITVFRIEGLSMPGVKDTAVEKGLAGISI